MKMILLTVAFLAAAAPALKGDEIARSKDGALTLSVLPRALVEKEVQGCSCSFYTEKKSRGEGRSVLAWEFGKEHNVPIQLNDQTRRLRVVSQVDTGKDGPDKELRKGDQTIFTLSGDKTKAVIDCRATATCAESQSESCEATFYQCKIGVDADGHRVDVAASGACGC